MPSVEREEWNYRGRPPFGNPLWHSFQPPGMGCGTGCAAMIAEGVLCGEEVGHRIHGAKATVGAA